MHCHFHTTTRSKPLLTGHERLAGIGFWHLGPYANQEVASNADVTEHSIAHGLAVFSDLCLAGYLLLIALKLTPLTLHPMHIDSTLTAYGRASVSALLAQSRCGGSQQYGSAVQPGTNDLSRTASTTADANNPAAEPGNICNLSSLGGSARSRRRTSMVQASRHSKASYTSPAPSDMPSFTVLYNGHGSKPTVQASNPSPHTIGLTDMSPAMRRSALRQPSCTRRDSQVHWSKPGLDALAGRDTTSASQEAGMASGDSGPSAMPPTALGTALSDLPESLPGRSSLHSMFGIQRSTAGTDVAVQSAASNAVLADMRPSQDNVSGANVPKAQGMIAEDAHDTVHASGSAERSI